MLNFMVLIKSAANVYVEIFFSYWNIILVNLLKVFSRSFIACVKFLGGRLVGVAGCPVRDPKYYKFGRGFGIGIGKRITLM